MSRRSFTLAIAKLICRMADDGVEPVLDWVLRSKEVQQMLFAKGRTKVSDGTWIVTNQRNVVTNCDGVTKISKHQKGEAADIYFVVTRPDGTVYIDYEGKETSDLYVKYHKIWEEMGGEPMIEWDKSNFEAA